MGDNNGGWDLASDVVVLTHEPASAALASHDHHKPQIDDDFEDLEELQLIQVQGRDIKGRALVRIVGKFLPATITDKERLQRYAVLKLTQFDHETFAIVYFHTAVQRDENSPGITTLRQIYKALPQQVKNNLETVYFVHPGIRSRVIFATLGRFFLSDGLYWKLQYISRIEFLRDHIKDGEIEVPEFVFQHDEELEENPLMDYGIFVDPLQDELKTQGSRYPSSSRPFF